MSPRLLFDALETLGLIRPRHETPRRWARDVGWTYFRIFSPIFREDEVPTWLARFPAQPGKGSNTNHRKDIASEPCFTLDNDILLKNSWPNLWTSREIRLKAVRKTVRNKEEHENKNENIFFHWVFLLKSWKNFPNIVTSVSSCRRLASDLGRRFDQRPTTIAIRLKRSLDEISANLTCFQIIFMYFVIVLVSFSFFDELLSPKVVFSACLFDEIVRDKLSWQDLLAQPPAPRCSPQQRQSFANRPLFESERKVKSAKKLCFFKERNAICV